MRLKTVGGSHLDGEKVVIILLELFAGAVLREEQLDEILDVVDRPWRKRVKPVRGYFLQTGGEDLPQDGVVTSINHHLVLILTEMLNWIIQIGVAVKGRGHEFLWKFTRQYALREGGVGSIDCDDAESAVMRYPCLLDSFLYKHVEILDADELLNLSLRMIMLISRMKMRRI